MATSHGDSSGILIDWFRSSVGNHGFTPPNRLIESQPWNNVSVYKEVLGEANQGLQLNAVMQIHSSEFRHSGSYECRAHDIRLLQRFRPYDTVTVEFTGMLFLFNQLSKHFFILNSLIC